MDLALQQNCRFQLRARRSDFHVSYSFLTSTKEEFLRYIHAIQASHSRRRLDMDTQNLIQSSLQEFILTPPPRTKHMILVRHGHYINAHVPYVADVKQVLSQMGRQQAELTGTCLRRLQTRIPSRYDVTVYHSDLTRAVETAALIAGKFDHGICHSSAMLREGWPGAPFSKCSTDSQRATSQLNEVDEALQKRRQLDLKRMQHAFDQFFTSTTEGDDHESYCILVCHANLIRFFLCRALGIEPAHTWGHFEINHCGLTRIDACPNQPTKVLAVNETGHLPQSLITSSEDHL